MVIGVTGATGLVGSHFAREALRNGCGVRFLSRSKSKISNDLERAGAIAVLGELGDAESVARLAAGCNVLVHCAAVTNCDAAFAEHKAVNLQGTQILLDACRQTEVGRLIHVSTPSVLVDGKHQIGIDESYPMPPKPIGLYAATKQAAEKLIAGQSDIEAIIIRPKAVFGIGDRTLLPEVVQSIRSGRLARVGRDPVLVGLTPTASVAQALLAAATVESPGSHLYHVDNGESIDLWQLISALRLAIGGPAKPLRTIPYRTCLSVARIADTLQAAKGGRTDSQRYRVTILGRSQTLNIAAASRELGYKPAVTVAEAMAEALYESVSPEAAAAFEAQNR